MPVNLAQFATPNQGKRDAIELFGNLIQNLPGMIRDNRDYQIKKQKFADNDTANKETHRQLIAVAEGLGLDGSIFNAPQTDQDHEDYLTRGMATIFTAAKRAGKTQDEVLNLASSLTGGGGVQQVTDAQNVLTQTQEAAATEQIAQGPLLRGLGGGGTQQTQPAGPFGNLIQGKQDVAAQDVAAQLEERIVTRLQTDKKNYTAADAYKEINAFNKAKQTFEQDNKMAELESETRIKEAFAKTILAAPGEIKLFDAEGNPVDAVTLQNMLSLGLGTSKKMEQPTSRTAHFTTRTGGSKGAKAQTTYDNLLNRYNQMSREIGDMAAVLLDPNKIAGSEIAKKYNLKNAKDVEIKLDEIQKTSNMVLQDMMHARKEEGFPELPEGEAEKADPQKQAAIDFGEKQGWDEAKIQRYLKRLGL